uniref:hypothetical protein n=1 Tax=Aeromonas caviae TaxID=648 RepID=UPI0019D4764B
TNQNLLFDFPLQADQQHCTVSTTLDALTRSPRGTDSTLFAVSATRGSGEGIEGCANGAMLLVSLQREIKK